MRTLLLSLLLAAPLVATASEPCKYQAPRHVQLDLAGVRGVQIELHSHTLHLTGSTTATGLTIDGRACASSQAALDDLQVTQRRDGDQLLVDVSGRGHLNMSLFGRSYAYLDLTGTVPSNMPVTLTVGSGDADVRGLQKLDSVVGSGDLTVSDIAGRFGASVGSGDIDADHVGSLALGSVGSGDVRASDIQGDAHIGSIGSGDVTLRGVGGSVHADTLGSGDLNVRNVSGDLQLGAKGSGDIDYSDIKGHVSVPHDND